MSGTELAVRPASGQTGDNENGQIRENGNGEIGESESDQGHTRESEIDAGHTGESESGQMEERFPCALPSCSSMASKKCSRCRAVYYCSRQATLQKRDDAMHYRLRSFKGVQFRLVNFVSNFKYFRYFSLSFSPHPNIFIILYFIFVGDKLLNQVSKEKGTS